MPFMILGLVGLHFIVDDKSPYMYTICLTMVFYTNFFFAPIVSIVHFLYYIGLLINKNKLNLGYIVKFVKAYLLAVLMGSLILIPVVFFVSDGVRGGNTLVTPGLFNSYARAIAEVVFYPYYLGIGIVPLLSSLYGLTLYKKDKHLYLPIVAFIIMVSFEKVIFLLNLNMYNELKHSIYFIPIIFLIFGKYIYNEKNNMKLTWPLTVTVLLILISSSIPIVDKSFLIIESSIILLLAISPTLKDYSMVLASLFIVITFNSSLLTINKDMYEELTINDKDQLTYNESDIKPYRYLEEGINELNSLDSFNPNIYTSLENTNYERLLNNVLELELAEPIRYHNNTVFDNYLVRNYMGIIKDTDSKENISDLIPMVYGVDNSQTFNEEQLTSLPIQKRLFAINEAVFTENSDKEYTVKAKPEVLYTSDRTFTAKDINKLKEINLPSKLKKDGVLIINFNTEIPDDSASSEKLKINNHTNKVMMNDYYGENPNSEVTFLIDTDEKLSKLTLFADTSGNFGEEFEYKNLQISFYSKDNLEKNEVKISKPTDFKVKLNHSYEFNLALNSDGYLSSTIPYDEGFKIYVDGSEVKTERVNEKFIGCKLDKGEHHILIKYEIKGYKTGIVCSLIAILIFLLKDIFRKKTS